MFENGPSKLTIGLGFVATIVGGVIIKKTFFTKKTRGTKGEAPEVTKELLVKIYTEFNGYLSRVLLQLKQQEASIRQRAAQMGKQVGEDDILAYLKDMLMKEVAELEPIIYSKNRVTKKDVMKAVKIHKDHPPFQEQHKKMQELVAVFKEPDEEEVPEDFDEDRMIEYFTQMMEDTNVVMEKTAKEVQEAGIMPNSDSKHPDHMRYQRECLMRFQPRAEEMSKSLPERFGITEKILQAALNKYKASVRVEQALVRLTEDQKARFVACGIDVGP